MGFGEQTVEDGDTLCDADDEAPAMLHLDQYNTARSIEYPVWYIFYRVALH